MLNPRLTSTTGFGIVMRPLRQCPVDASRHAEVFWALDTMQQSFLYKTMAIPAPNLTEAIITIGLLIIVLTVVVLRYSSFYSSLVEHEIASNRFHSIDGLRGFLAIGVLFHHASINYQFYQTGKWALTPSRLSTLLGHGSVAFFFMVTAFLYWGRAIDARGHLDAYRFFASRLRRMVPMYTFSAALLLTTAFALTHFRLQVSPWDLVRQVASWLLFTIPGGSDVNAFSNTYLINSVFWSLAYEWKFYIVLPFFAVFARGVWQWIIFPLVALLICLYSPANLEWFFLGGSLAAVLTRLPLVRKVGSSWIGTVSIPCCLAAAYHFQPMIYSAIGAAILLPGFVAVASGNSFFQTLTCRPARLLGLISYSIYLTHNWVLYVTYRTINHFHQINSLSVYSYWSICAVIALATVALSAFTYRFIEHPYMKPHAKSVPRPVENEHTM